MLPVFKLTTRALLCSLLATGVALSTVAPAANACWLHNKQSAPQLTQPKLIETLEGIHHYQLPSGQHVYLKHSTDQPIITLDTWVDTGSVNETDDTNGISHFLEHLLFKGTNLYKEGDIDRTLEAMGGQFNAATSLDFTHYFVQMPTSAFAKVLDIHANMLLNASLPEDAVNRERLVVQEEINRALDNPQSRLIRTLTATLFKNHGYAYDTLGPKFLIDSVPRDTIHAYYQHWYQPQHFHTIVVGNIKPQQALQQVAEAFAKHMPATFNTNKKVYSPPTWPAVSAPKQPTVLVLEDDNITQAYLTIGFLGPNAKQTDDTFALDAGMMIVGQGKSARLHQTLKETEHIVQSVGAGNWTQQDAGLAYLTAQIPLEHLDAAPQRLFDVLHTTVSNGVTPAELAKAKTQTKKSYVFLNESTGGQAQNIGYNVTIANLTDYTDYDEGIDHVRREDVQHALAQYLNPKTAIAIAMVPKGKVDTAHVKANLSHVLHNTPWPTLATLSSASTADTPQEDGTAETLSATTLPNGMRLITKTRPDTDTVSLQWFIGGGRSTEPMPGVASLLAGLLDKGTTLRSQAELANTLESNGMSVGTGVNEDSLQVSATGLKEHTSDLLWIVADILKNPRLSEDDLATLKTDIDRNIQSSQEKPAALALQTLQQHLYPNHNYGNVGERIAQHLPLITREDIVAYYHRHITPDNMTISAVGNVDTQELARNLQAAFPGSINAMATHTLQGQPATHTSPRVAQPVPALAAKQTVPVSKPKQAATWVTRGWLAPAITDKKAYAALKLLNTVLGTGLSSRLFVELREKQGLAYVAASFFPSHQQQSRFVMYIGTDPANEAKVLDGFDEQIKRLQTEPLTEQELTDAKQKLLGHFGLAHESNADQAFYLGLYENLGVGYGFDAEYPDLINALTAEDVLNAANTIFNQPMVTVIVSPDEVRTEDAVVRE